MIEKKKNETLNYREKKRIMLRLKKTMRIQKHIFSALENLPSVAEKKQKNGFTKTIFSIFGILFLVLPFSSVAADFSLPEDASTIFLSQGTLTAVTSETITDEGNNLTGNHEVLVSLDHPVNGELDKIVIMGENGATSIIAGEDPKTLYSAYNFSDSVSKLGIQMSPPEGKHGNATLTFIIKASTDITVMANIDTRFSENINVGIEGYVGQKYGNDPYGWRLNFRPNEGNAEEKKGVSVTGTRMTGMIWSETFGWIDLQPPEGGIYTTVIDSDITKLSGLAWNEQIGWIDFSPQITASGTEGGVYIDENGFFQGTAWAENFGYFSFGAYTEFDPIVNNQTAEPLTINDWARTTWRPQSLHAPTISLVGPDDNAIMDSRQPLFSFHIEDEDGWDKVGYTINILKKNKDAEYISYISYTQPATLDTNEAGEKHTYTPNEILPPGEYQWSMTAKDERGVVSSSTETRNFTITNGAPVVTLLSPEDNVNIVGRRPTFSFHIEDSNGDTMNYIVQISSSPLFEIENIVTYSSLQEEKETGEYTYTPLRNIPAGTLYWRVFLEDKYGTPADTFPVRTISVENAPPTLEGVTLKNSAGGVIPNNESTTDNTPLVYWTSVDSDGNTMNATIEVYDSENKLISTIKNIMHTAGIEQRKALKALNSGESYSYRIQSCDSDNVCTEWKSGNFSVENGIRVGNIGTPDVLNIHPGSMVGSTTEHDAPIPEGTWVDNDSSDNKYAWTQTAGWIDLNPIGGGVIVEGENVRGFAWNDSLGWIRMSCLPYSVEPDENDTGNCLDTNGDSVINEDDDNYGIKNDGNGNLSGKALVESTGEYIYFDRASYLKDNPPIIGNDQNAIDEYWNSLSPDTDINVHISCEEKYKGHFFGYAYSTDLGWVVLGREDLYEYLTAENKNNPGQTAANFFPITEWSCDKSTAPVLIEENFYTVSAAKTSEINIAIAKKKNDGDPDLSCGASNFSIEEISVNDDGTVTSGTPIPNGLDCTILDGEMILSPKSEYSTTAGLYRISGVVSNGTDTVNMPVAGLANNQFILQIVAGKPDLSNVNTITQIETKAGTKLIADGKDSLRIIATIYDAFDNPVVKEYQYQNENFELLKKVKSKITFENNVKTDQINGIQEGTEDPVSGLPLNNIKKSTDNNILIDISSIAPTTLGYNLSIKNVGSLVEAVSLLGDDLGQTENGGNWVTRIPVNGDILFYPVLTATVDNFSEFASTFNNTKGSLNIHLKNESGLENITQYRWIGMARKKNIVGEYVDTVYQSTQILRNEKRSNTNNYWQEINYNLGSSTTSQFDGIFEGKLPESENIYNVQGDTIFQAINSGLSMSFDFDAYVVDGISTEEKIPEFTQYAAIKFTTDGPIIKFPLGTEQQYGTSENIKLSIAGATHGNEFNENLIVSESDAFSDFTTSEQAYTRQDIRQIMYSNYQSMTGLLEADTTANTTNGSHEIVRFDSYDDGTNKFTTDKDNEINNKWIQDGGVRWVEKSDPTRDLSVILGDGSESFVVNTAGAQTLMVYGGNVYIKENIYIQDGSNFGIMVLASRENAENGTEGNIFIDPSVTHIEGVFYADGSIMSATDGSAGTIPNVIEEDEIFDGFSDKDVSKIFSNQLYISGSIVSRNTAGTLLSDTGTFMTNTWLPTECSTGTCENDLDFEKAAMRYDLAYIRHFGLLSEYNDSDKDLIRDDMDCDTTPTANGCVDQTDADGNIIGHYNELCESSPSVIDRSIYGTNHCAPIVTQKVAKNNGQCAENAEWCSCEVAECTDNTIDVPFTLDCESSNACDSAGNLSNAKIGAAMIIEYDPVVQTLTPPGMTLPSQTTFN